MSRIDANRAESLDNQDPTKDTDGDKKPKSRRPASETVTPQHPFQLLLLDTYGISHYEDTAFRQQRLKAWQ